MTTNIRIPPASQSPGITIPLAATATGSSLARFGFRLGAENIAEAFRTRDGDLKVADEAIGQAIDPAMQAELLAAGPGILHDRCLGQVYDLLADIQLAQRIQPLVFVDHGPQIGLVLLVGLADRQQPVIDQAALFGLPRRPHAAAAVMAGYAHKNERAAWRARGWKYV